MEVEVIVQTVVGVLLTHLIYLPLVSQVRVIQNVKLNVLSLMNALHLGFMLIKIVNYGLLQKMPCWLIRIHLDMTYGGKEDVKTIVKLITLEEGLDRVVAGSNVMVIWSSSNDI